jgi:hypothetical protein
MLEDDAEFKSNQERERRKREAFLAVVYTARADGRGRLSIKNRLAGGGGGIGDGGVGDDENGCPARASLWCDTPLGLSSDLYDAPPNGPRITGGTTRGGGGIGRNGLVFQPRHRGDCVVGLLTSGTAAPPGECSSHSTTTATKGGNAAGKARGRAENGGGANAGLDGLLMPPPTTRLSGAAAAATSSYSRSVVPHRQQNDDNTAAAANATNETTTAPTPNCRRRLGEHPPGGSGLSASMPDIHPPAIRFPYQNESRLLTNVGHREGGLVVPSVLPGIIRGKSKEARDAAERIREHVATTVAADLWRARARERMARIHAKSKEVRDAVERISEHVTTTVAANLRRARARQRMAHIRAKSKEARDATERIREHVATTVAANLWRARARIPLMTMTPMKRKTMDTLAPTTTMTISSLLHTPSPSTQFLQQSTVPKVVRPHEESNKGAIKGANEATHKESNEGAIKGANEATHEESNEGVNELESCFYSDFLSHKHSLTQIAKEIFDDLFCNQFRTPWSEGKGIVISGDSCYGNPIKINIHRPSYLRQNYGLNSNSAVMFNRDDYRACYGTGGGMKTLGIPKR